MAHIVLRDRDGNLLLEQELTESVTVGRSSECALFVDDSRASRHHCEIKRWGNAWKVSDLNSSNRTYVNGKCIKEHVLQDGDQIEVGHHTLTYLSQKSARTRAANPVLAGLVDAETSARPVSAAKRSSSRDDSSLFATCVVPHLTNSADETLINSELLGQSSITSSTVLPPRPIPTAPRSWRLPLAAALAVISVSAMIWAIWL